jgi:hypothetical protein
VRKLIVGKLRSEAAGEVVIPSRNPAAQVGDPRLIKPVLSKVSGSGVSFLVAKSRS